MQASHHTILHKRDTATDTYDLISRVDVSTQTDAKVEVSAQIESDEITNSASGLVDDNYDSDSTEVYTLSPTCAVDTTGPRIGGDDEYDSDATKLDSPTPEIGTEGDDYEYFYDSDATTLDSSVPTVDAASDSDSSHEGSYIETYVTDPTYDGPAYPSQPCGKHGASYTPPGWKRVMMKRRKLFHDSKAK